MPQLSIERGKRGEQLAENYLLRRHYRIRERHWTCREGELDFIAYDTGSEQLVFIEVKMRTSSLFGSPEEAINNNKKRRLFRAIEQYLISTSHNGSYRFDAICIIQKNAQTRISHYKNLGLSEDPSE